MTKRFKHLLTVFFTFIGGLYFFMEFMLPKNINGFEFGKYHDQISKGIQVAGLMALGLGIINILRVHGNKIIKTKDGYINSIALILGLFIMLGVEGVNLYQSEKKLYIRNKIENLILFVDVIKKDSIKNLEKDPELRVLLLVNELKKIKIKLNSNKNFLANDAKNKKANFLFLEFKKNLNSSIKEADKLKLSYKEKNFDKINLSSKNLIYSLKETALLASKLTSYNYEKTSGKKISHFFFHAFFVPLGASMFSLLAFYIATAAYRSFRIRSLEAFVMMVPAILVMLGQIPHGPKYVSAELPEIRRWLMEYLNTPAFRAIFFGASIAALAMAVRMWLSLEKSPLSNEAEEKK